MTSAVYHHKGCRLCARFTFAIIGTILGFSGTLCFAIIYKNYHCAIWAFLSGVLALITFTLHLAVWRDVTYSMSTALLKNLKLLGVVGSVLGFCVLVGYLIKGILVHESGVQVRGWFIVTVWGWMVWKWSFLLFWYSKNYLKALIASSEHLVNINA